MIPPAADPPATTWVVWLGYKGERPYPEMGRVRVVDGKPVAAALPKAARWWCREHDAAWTPVGAGG